MNLCLSCLDIPAKTRVPIPPLESAIRPPVLQNSFALAVKQPITIVGTTNKNVSTHTPHNTFVPISEVSNEESVGKQNLSIKRVPVYSPYPGYPSISDNERKASSISSELNIPILEDKMRNTVARVTMITALVTEVKDLLNETLKEKSANLKRHGFSLCEKTMKSERFVKYIAVSEKDARDLLKENIALFNTKVDLFRDHLVQLRRGKESEATLQEAIENLTHHTVSFSEQVTTCEWTLNTNAFLSHQARHSTKKCIASCQARVDLFKKRLVRLRAAIERADTVAATERAVIASAMNLENTNQPFKEAMDNWINLVRDGQILLKKVPISRKCYSGVRARLRKIDYLLQRPIQESMSLSSSPDGVP